MIKQEEFLSKYNLTLEEFAKAELEWAMLETIYANYESIKSRLADIGDSVLKELGRIEKIHSLKTRIKNSEHLIEKIIRKKQKNPARIITLDNYQQEITDLIGVRALHLFKHDWIDIHDQITSTFALQEKPIAYIRGGDVKDLFEKAGCEIKEHKTGYRSIHYIARFSYGKTSFIVEIQVRTIFEEGWSEVDHQLRYPYEINDPLLTEYLKIFSGFAGSADEMASFIKCLKKNLMQREQTYKEELEKKILEKTEIISTLEKIEKELKDTTKEKEELHRIIGQMKDNQGSLSSFLLCNKFNEGIMQKGISDPLKIYDFVSSFNRQKLFSHTCTNCKKELPENSLHTVCPQCLTNYYK